MYQFMQRFGRAPQARSSGAQPLTRVRRRDHQLNCEALEGRQLLSGYYIVNEASGKVLDDPYGLTGNLTPVNQYPLNGGTNQVWDLLPVGNGNFVIENEASHLVLDNSLSTVAGSVIDQYQWYGGANQQWQVYLAPNASLGNGNFFCSGIVNAYSHMALDNALSTVNGSNIYQWTPYAGSNQRWFFLAAGSIYNGAYDMINEGTGKEIASDGNNFFDFVPLADGFDLIVTFTTGLAEDDPNFSTVPGTPIDGFTLNGGLNQQWQVVEQGNGTEAIFNASSHLVMDDATQAPYAPYLNEWYGGPTQEWYSRSLNVGVDIHGQPSNAVVGQPISPAITVAVVDAKGNTVTTNNSQLVTLAIASGPAGAQLLGTTTIRAVNGVADFTNLRLSLPGTYTLTATGGALTPDFSNVFTIAPAKVASHVTIRRGSVHKVGRNSHRGSGGELVAQTITIKNAGRQPLGGPLALRVGRLPTGVTLANATGTYEGGSYRDVLAADQPLASGKSVTVTLDFSVSGRRSHGLGKLDEDVEALLGI